MNRNETRQALPVVRASRVLGVGATILAASLPGCTSQESSAANVGWTEPMVYADPDLPPVFATIGDEEIKMEDVRVRVGDQLDQIEAKYLQQRHAILNETVKTIVRDRLLLAEAVKRGVGLNALIQDEIGGNLDVTEADIVAFYEGNPSQMQGRSLEELHGEIEDHLRSTRKDEVLNSLEARLAEERGVEIRLEPFRLVLDNTGAPSIGPSDAAVTLVEFSDFECPFCGRFFPTLHQIIDTYGDDIRVVYRQFPLTSIHPSAFKAAEASLCANEQGSFWDYHDTLFQEQGRLLVRDLKEKAARLGLDQQEFNTCLDTGRYVEQVQNDLSAGRAAGVSGTPAVFVNGIVIEGGAVDFRVVADLIDEELARAKQ